MNLIVIEGRLLGSFQNGMPINVSITDEQVKYFKEHPFDITEEWILNTFFPKINEEKENTAMIKNELSDLEQTGLFYTKNGSLYRLGIDLSIPELLINEYKKSLNTDRFNALDNFWKLCSLNPDARARQDLFKFLQKGQFTITSSGLFVAYRNVLVQNEGATRELTEFVNNIVVKIKAWKKSPKNFIVVKKDNELNYFDGKRRDVEEGEELLGYVSDLVDEVDDVTYTDNHTKTFRINIGVPVTMDRDLCDNNAGQDCSRGLHLGNSAFLNSGTFGSVGLVCLCNPYNVVSVPEYNSDKLRCCEYLPIGIAEYNENGKLIEIDTLLYEDDYCQFTVDQINQMLEEAHMKEFSINTLFTDLELSNAKIREIANEAILTKNKYYYED